MDRLKFMLQCTICLPVGGMEAQMESKMSKRLMTSAVIATLMMASTIVYSSASIGGEQTAAIPTMSGG